MNALMALLEQKGASAEQLKPLRSLYEKISDKQRMRNRIVHDPWYFHFNQDGSTTGYRLESSAKKTLVRKLIEHDLAPRSSMRSKALYLQSDEPCRSLVRETATLTAMRDYLYPLGCSRGHAVDRVRAMRPLRAL